MKVHCQNCLTFFEIPQVNPGSVSFLQCKNVFRISYSFKTPCPHCKKILQLTPDKGKSFLGIPDQKDAWDEPTEISSIQPSTDIKTNPTSISLPSPSSPEIKVTLGNKKETSSQAPTQIKPFRMIPGSPKENFPKHLPISPRRKRNISIFKILISSFILVAVGITLLFFVFTFQHPSKDSLSQSLSQEEPMGGPEESLQENSVAERYFHPSTSEQALLTLPELKNLTSGFGMRLDPFSKKPAFHGGLDFKTEYRAEAKAALKGVVKFIGKKPGYGNLIVLQHGNGLETRYGHLAKILVKKGQTISQGELIGLTGSTGRSTGPHLHIEFLENGKKVDPLKIQLPSQS